MRTLNVQTQQLQIELQDLERKKKFKAAEVQTTKEHIEAAKVLAFALAYAHYRRPMRVEPKAGWIDFMGA